MPNTSLPDRSIGLDVMRSVAILLVLFSHYTNNFSAWFGWHPPQVLFQAGDIGVDLFFVLSGFLIGRILLELAERDPSRRGLLRFLVRRWMRTLPLYVLWLAVLLLVWPPASDWRGIALRNLTMTQNLAWAMPPGYWFAVSWSLAVEEWFYLLFGAALLACVALVRRPWAVWIPLAVFLLVPPLLRFSVPAYFHWSSGLTKAVVFCLDQIAYGVVLAWLYRRGSALFRHPAPAFVAGLLLIACACWDLLPIPFHVYWAVVSDELSLGCMLCLPGFLALRPPPFPLAWLARRLSAQSYALYLIHLTILVDLAQGALLRHALTRGEAVAVAVLLPPGLSYLSYRFFEFPILRWRPAQFPRGLRAEAAERALRAPPGSPGTGSPAL